MGDWDTPSRGAWGAPRGILIEDEEEEDFPQKKKPVVIDDWEDSSEEEDEGETKPAPKKEPVPEPKPKPVASTTTALKGKKKKGKKGKWSNKKSEVDEWDLVESKQSSEGGTSGTVDADDAFLGGEADKEEAPKESQTSQKQAPTQIVNQQVDLNAYKITSVPLIEEFGEKIGRKFAEEAKSDMLMVAFLKKLLQTSKLKKDGLLKVRKVVNDIYNAETKKKKQAKGGKKPTATGRGLEGANSQYVDYQASQYDEFDDFFN